MRAIPERRTEFLLLLVFAIALAAHVRFFHYTVDDAFISLRYAENWAEGRGLVFNPGERVEGYTNFLWTALLAAGLRAGLEPVMFGKGMGLAAGILLCSGAFLFARRRLPRHSLAFLVPVPLVASGAFAVWCGAGLETSLFALLLFSGTAAATGPESPGRFTAASLLFALATLTRPEGALLFAVVLGDRLILRRTPVRSTAPGALLFFAIVGAHEAWRIAYYGDPLPNTFYAKSGGGFRAAGRGLRYLAKYAGPFGGWTALAPVPLLFAGPLRRWERTFLLVLAAYLAYVVVVGGDSLPFYRFLVPAIPLLAVLAVAGLDRLFSFRDGNVSGIRVFAFALLLALPLHSSFRGETVRFLEEDRDRIDLHWTVIGKWLRMNAEPGASIAVTVAGAIPYYSKLPAVDMLGITEPFIARKKMPAMGGGLAGHEKYDMEHVLSRKPTYILHYPFLLPEPVFRTGHFRTPWNRGLAELLESATFDREYRGESAAIGPMHLVYFKRKEGV
ncbi:MAG: hypothetical protein ABIK65_05060 [Candidatus Eisenbacteria bacterium]